MTRPRRLTAGCLAPTLKHLLCGPCQLWPARKRSSLRVYIHINTTVLMMFQVISSPWARLPRKSRLFYQLPDNEILTLNEAGCGNVRRWLYRVSVGGVWPRAITQVECLFSQWFLSLSEQHLRMISLHCNGAEPRRDTIGQTVRNSGRFGKQKHMSRKHRRPAGGAAVIPSVLSEKSESRFKRTTHYFMLIQYLHFKSLIFPPLPCSQQTVWIQSPFNLSIQTNRSEKSLKT